MVGWENNAAASSATAAADAPAAAVTENPDDAVKRSIRLCVGLVHAPTTKLSTRPRPEHYNRLLVHIGSTAYVPRDADNQPHRRSERRRFPRDCMVYEVHLNEKSMLRAIIAVEVKPSRGRRMERSLQLQTEIKHIA